jgi:hypothetical protein|tara:strand:- start:604 stop:948 length:345 start_codon:yes stop_codon:yes gene_type:complete
MLMHAPVPDKEEVNNDLGEPEVPIEPTPQRLRATTPIAAITSRPKWQLLPARGEHRLLDVVKSVKRKARRCCVAANRGRGARVPAHASSRRTHCRKEAVEHELKESEAERCRDV